MGWKIIKQCSDNMRSMLDTSHIYYDLTELKMGGQYRPGHVRGDTEAHLGPGS